MADNNKEDLSMEEILSSIRNILTNADGTPVQAEAPEEAEDLSMNDTVFDLSKEMMVDDKPVYEEDKPVYEYEPVAKAASEQDIDPIADIDNLLADEELNSHDEDLLNETMDEELLDNLEDDLLLEAQETPEPEAAQEIEENLEEEFIQTEEDDLEETLQHQLAQETVSVPDDNLEQELHKAHDEDLMPSFNTVEIDTTSEPIFDEALDDEVAEIEVDQFDNTSSSILNKFAEVFEADQQRKLFEDVARDEIARQTQVWLDANLKNIVIEQVQKELDRVMAKVGK